MPNARLRESHGYQFNVYWSAQRANGEVVGLTIFGQYVPMNITSKRKRWERLTFIFFTPSTYA